MGSTSLLPLNRTAYRKYSITGSGIAKTALIVSSSDGTPFLLQVFISNDDSSEGFLGLPLDTMLKQEAEDRVYEYIVATMCATGGYCQLAIAAVRNYTYVSIKLPVRVPPIIFCVGKQTFNSSESKSITLMKFETVQYETTVDLTGTHIYSYKPIVVFAGSRKRIDSDPSHTVEQLVPSTHWGRDVTIGPSKNRTSFVKILNNHPKTTIRIKKKVVVVTDKYFTIVRSIAGDESFHVSADKPIQVMCCIVMTFDLWFKKKHKYITNSKSIAQKHYC